MAVVCPFLWHLYDPIRICSKQLLFWLTSNCAKQLLSWLISICCREMHGVLFWSCIFTCVNNCAVLSGDLEFDLRTRVVIYCACLKIDMIIIISIAVILKSWSSHPRHHHHHHHHHLGRLGFI